MSERPKIEQWMDVTAAGQKVRHPLGEGLTRLGGLGCDLVIPGAPGDELHVWSDPPKIVQVGDASTPLLNGRAFDEAELQSGDSIQWGEAVLVFGRNETASVTELSPGGTPLPSEPALAQGVAPAPSDRMTRRIHAGLLADLGLAKRPTLKLWQDAVVRGEFDPDACARDLVNGDVPGPEDPRVLERAGRLQRDLLMMPFQRGIRGATRRARGATRKGAAVLVANLIAIVVYSLVLVAIMVLVRVNYDFSFDRVIDAFLDIF